MDKYALPDRWLHCPKLGSVIADTFVPFKTPLDSRYHNAIEKEELLWEPETLLAACESRGIKLGLVFDLTNSKRYYKSDAFTSREVIYKKIACRGHNETPDEDAKHEFVAICNGYLQSHPGKKIGVHCTHGFNRTGYLICTYLVEELNWSLSSAVIAFQKARDPGIYKPDYIAALTQKYGEEDEMPEIAERPMWEDPAVLGDQSERGKRSKEFMSGIPGVSLVDDADETREIQKMAAEWCGFKRKGFPGSQPVSMDCDNLLNLKDEHHVVSWKADGTRYMMVIAGQNRVYFLDRDNAVFKVDGLTFLWKDLRQHLQCTLLDGEMVIDVDADGTNIPRYLIYDIVFCEKYKIGDLPFVERVKCIKTVVIGSRRSASERGLINVDREPFRVRLKEFYDVSMTGKLLGKKFQSQLSHEIDGLIFQPSAKPYKADRCDYILKWKPPELNTIDFRLRIERTGQTEGSVCETVGFLFVGGQKEPFTRLGKFTKEHRKLNGKIVECGIQHWLDKYNRPTSGWVILRERTDKSFPNGYKTAMGVMKSIQKPLSKDTLIDFINGAAIKNQKWDEPAASKRPPQEAPSSQGHSYRPKVPRTDM